MPAVGERGRPLKVAVRARAKAKPKVIYAPRLVPPGRVTGKPAPIKKPVYGPPAPAKKVYGPPAPKRPAPRPRPVPPRAPRKPTFAEQQAHKARTRNVVRETTAEAHRVRPNTSAAAIENYKQSPAYIRTLQEARATRAHRREGESAKQAQARIDRAFVPKDQPRPLEPSKRGLIGPPAPEKAGPPAPPKKGPELPVSVDEPRTSAELREFLKSGRRPIDTMKGARVTAMRERKRKEERERNRSLPQKALDEITNKKLREKYERQAAGREGKGGGLMMGKLMAAAHAPLAGHRLAGMIPGGDKVSKILGAGSADVGELIASTPTSVAHTVKTAVTEPWKLPKEMAEPYVETVKHPIKSVTERPVSTGLLVAPVARVPGLAAGKVLRKTGKQTLMRPPATLPGTALKAERVGSRDALVRAWQARQDRKRGAPTMTAAEVQKRVDEFYDFAQHKGHQAADRAAREAKDQGMDAETAKAHVEKARADTDIAMREQFAREFGANVRPSVGKAEKKSAKVEKKQAGQRAEEARERELAAEAEVKRAYGEASASRGTGTSDRLTALEAERKAAQADVAGAKVAQVRARLEQAKAHGSARVSAATAKTSDRLRELQGKLKKAEKGNVTEAVTAARAAVREADKKVTAIERQMQRERETQARLAGVTEGRSKAGKMTTSAGRKVADQAEKVGVLTDVLTAARRGAADARAALKAAEAEGRAANKVTTGDIKKQISAEQKRLAGVAPGPAGRLMAAIQAVDDAPANIAAARQRVRDIDREISGERGRVSGVPPAQHDALLRALAEREDARAAGATRRAERGAAEQRHSDIRQQAINATLTGAQDAGRIFQHEADAKKVVQRLNEGGSTQPIGGVLPARFVEHEGGMQTLHRRGNVNLPLEFKVQKVGDRFAVVPKVASTRLMKHQKVGTAKATEAKILRRSRQALTKATLPFSLKWLGGQAGEAGLRAAVERAGPLDRMRLERVVKRMNEIKEGAGDDFMTRISGGQFGVTGAAREFADADTLAKEFKDTYMEQPARLATAAGQTLPGRGAKAAVNGVNKVVLGKINGFIEENTRKAMAGQYIKDTFNEKRFNALSDKAIDEAARGLMGTEAQIGVGRALNRMYGQYSKFSPQQRSLMAHWTPFLPWYINSVKWLAGTLPRRHPVLTSLMASAGQATEDWRRERQLSMIDDPDHIPDYLMGSYPIFGEDKGLSRLGAITPFGIGSDFTSTAHELLAPQLMSPLLNSFGLDWTGTKFIRNPDTGKVIGPWARAARAGGSLVESQVPGASLASRLSGFGQRYLNKTRPEDMPSFRKRLEKEVPLMPMGGTGGGGGEFDIDPIDIEGIDLEGIDID